MAGSGVSFNNLEAAQAAIQIADIKFACLMCGVAHRTDRQAWKACHTRLGQMLEKDPQDLEDSSMVDFFQQNNRKIKVYDELKKAAKGNRHIQIYLEHCFWVRKYHRLTLKRLIKCISFD